MILVSLRYDGGVAAVYRAGDEVWLGVGPAEDVASLGGTLLDSGHGRVGIGGGRWAVGGLPPPGAADAVVEGRRGVAGHTDESRGTGGPLGGPTEPSAVVVCTR